MNRKSKILSQKDLIKLFRSFIRDSQTGKRLKKDGKKIRSGTIDSYTYTFKNLVKFSEEKKFELRLYLVKNLNTREFEQAKKYWKGFYKEFTDYLYNDLDHYDNYVGLMIKSLRTFFNYLKSEQNLDVGLFHRDFYIPVEQVPIIALSPDQLNYLAYDRNLNSTLPDHLEQAKDMFVFGCTVALRVSDLLALEKQNIYREKNSVYIQVRSGKTNTFTSIKLPDYAESIIEKYSSRSKKLLPQITIAHFNRVLKELGRHIEFDEKIYKTREKRGKKITIFKDPVKKNPFTLADLITTHTMRRTGITTLLRMGMPDYLVRKISGHAAGSKEFFRYAQLAQSYLDEKTDEAFQKLSGFSSKGLKKDAVLA